jgi:hypothetical protein
MKYACPRVESVTRKRSPAQLDSSDPSSYSWNVISSLLQVPTLTRSRVTAAYVAAVVTDGLQLLAGPLGWVAFDQALDVVAAVLMWRLLGFHPLLLPTFVVEFLPVADMLPTWTGCVALVVALRKRQQRSVPARTQGTIIDV